MPIDKNEKAPTSLGVTVGSGITWLLAQTVVTRGGSLLSQLILARLLMPEDFGVFGLAATLSAFFGVVIYMGVDQVLQQRSKHLNFWATQTFVIGLVLSVVCGIVLACCAPLAAAHYNNDKIIPLILVSAFSLPFQVLSSVPSVRLRADLRFKFIATYNAFDYLVSQLATILMALTGMGAISFVLGTLLSHIVRAVVFWSVSWVPLRSLRRARGSVLMIRRGIAVMGSRLSNVAVEQGDYMTLGLLCSAETVGFYYFAFRLAVQPMQMLASSFTSVLMPSLITLNAEPVRQREAAFKTAELLGLLVVPLCLMLAAVAEPLLILLFGDHWLGAIPFLQILSLGLALDAVSWPAGTLWGARGKFWGVFKIHVSFVFVFFLFVVSGGLAYGAYGVAWGVVAYYVLHPLTFSLIVFLREGYSLARIFRSYAVPYVIAGVTIGSAYLLSFSSVFDGLLLVRMLFILCFGGLAYMACVRFFLPAFYAEISLRLLAVMKKNLSR